MSINCVVSMGIFDGFHYHTSLTQETRIHTIQNESHVLNGA